MWSLGVMAFALFVGKLPFDDKDESVKKLKTPE
jgi:serine/threonine protein kinase